MGKTIDDLTKSREARARILKQFDGELPQSIIRAEREDKAIDDIALNERKYTNTMRDGGDTGKMRDVDAAIRGSFSISGRTCRGEGAGLSRFPQNVGRKLVLFYTKKNDTVLDPFAGHNSRMELCWRAGRNYMGNDISAYFQEINEKIKKHLLSEARSDFFSDHFNATIELTVGDSRHLPWENGIGDFTITSPPYYNLEHYGDEPEQLGLGARSYYDFLNRLELVCEENFRVLKPGRFAIWCVNDFRLDGKFYSYHSDTIKIMQHAGFVQHDICIIDLGVTIAQAFAAQAVENKLLPKRHEYALIFKKPM